MKDTRYLHVGKLIRLKEFATMKQVVEYLPKTVLARDIGVKVDRMSDKLQDVREFSVNELCKIADLFEVGLDEIFALVLTQYQQENRFRKEVPPEG